MRPPMMCMLVLEDTPTERFYFESFPAEEGIQENYTSNWNADKAPAPEPAVWMWGGGQWSMMPLELELVAGIWDSEFSPSTEEQLLQELEEKVRWLQALGFPRGRTERPQTQLKTNSRPGDPPTVLLVLGQFMTLRCICGGTAIRWGGPWDPDTVRPHSCKVTLQLQRASGFYPDWYTVKAAQTMLNPPVAGISGRSVLGV